MLIWSYNMFIHDGFQFCFLTYCGRIQLPSLLAFLPKSNSACKVKTVLFLEYRYNEVLAYFTALATSFNVIGLLTIIGVSRASKFSSGKILAILLAKNCVYTWAFF